MAAAVSTVTTLADLCFRPGSSKWSMLCTEPSTFSPGSESAADYRTFWAMCQSQARSGTPERSWKRITSHGDRLTSFMVGTLTIRRGISLPLQSFKSSSFPRLSSSSGTSDVVRLTDFLLVRLALLPRTWAFFKKSKVRCHVNCVGFFCDDRPQL